MNFIEKYIEYLKDNPQKYWFKRKLYGWGWTPATWQGWLCIGVFVVVLVVLSFDLKENPFNHELIWFFTKVITAVAILIAVCFKKGEKPKWQWGRPKKND